MNKVKILALVGVLASVALLTAACSEHDKSPKVEKNQQSNESSEPMSDAVAIDVSASKTENNRVIIRGSTNLPDGAELLISLSNDALGSLAQDKAVVKNGSFSSEPLGPKSGLVDAEYVVDVVMPLASTQSEHVQKIIGSKGEYLRGPLAKKSTFSGKLAEFQTTYVVGSEEARKQAIESHQKFVAELENTAHDLLNKGRAMSRLRETDDLDLIRECGDKMRGNQQRAKELRAKTQTLPSKYFGLRVAAIELNMCVSCSRTAIEACDRAEKSLNGED